MYYILLHLHNIALWLRGSWMNRPAEMPEHRTGNIIGTIEVRPSIVASSRNHTEWILYYSVYCVVHFQSHLYEYGWSSLMECLTFYRYYITIFVRHLDTVILWLDLYRVVVLGDIYRTADIQAGNTGPTCVLRCYLRSGVSQKVIYFYTIFCIVGNGRSWNQ